MWSMQHPLYSYHKFCIWQFVCLHLVCGRQSFMTNRRAVPVAVLFAGTCGRMHCAPDAQRYTWWSYIGLVGRFLYVTECVNQVWPYCYVFLGGQCGRIKYIVQVRPLTRDSVRCGPLVMLGAPREAAPPAPHTQTRAVQPNTMNVLKKRFSEHLSS